jgi:hypothetical protein
MAIGSVRGVMVSTAELFEEVEFGLFVVLDHEMFEVTLAEFRDGLAVVTLSPQFGPEKVVEVFPLEWDEPMWELEGQS